MEILDELHKIDVDILSIKCIVSLSKYGIHCSYFYPLNSSVQWMQFRWVMKSPLFYLNLAHNFTCQQSAVQKVISEIPGSRSYRGTYENVLNCQWVSIHRSETDFQELCGLQDLTSKPGNWHSKRKQKISNANPKYLSNANHGKKTASLLRHICTCHLKLEGSGEIIHFNHFVFGDVVSSLMSSPKILLK